MKSLKYTVTDYEIKCRDIGIRHSLVELLVNKLERPNVLTEAETLYEWIMNNDTPVDV